METLARSILIAATGSLLGGCMTMYTISPDRVEGEMYEYPDGPQSMPRMFSGVCKDVSCFTAAKSGDIGAICFVDTLFSAVADTVILPYTAIQQIRLGNFHPRLVPEIHEEAMKQRSSQHRTDLEACRRFLAKPSDFTERHPEYAVWCKRLVAED